MTRIYISRDSGALALGADSVAKRLEQEAKERGIELEIVRNGSRGMYWLEPLVEVETDQGRVGYGPVKPSKVDDFIEAGILEGKPHDKCIGLVDEYPWFKNQTRLTFARIGITDPRSLQDYQAHGGFASLKNAIEAGPDGIIEEDLRLARPWRRRLPHRHQMAHGR